MEIEFDPEKARANPINHEGVTIEEARLVLLDPYALTREDRDTKGEIRFVSLGMGGKGPDSGGGVDAEG
ncbi:BrnT family toxin [Magnetovirga frankeli]|uniref:BrnT family toxin n=1 Tax=Magnetovirga frankeli TaxID=947516 RepID=UPI003D3421AD